LKKWNWDNVIDIDSSEEAVVFFDMTVGEQAGTCVVLTSDSDKLDLDLVDTADSASGKGGTTKGADVFVRSRNRVSCVRPLKFSEIAGEMNSPEMQAGDDHEHTLCKWKKHSVSAVREYPPGCGPTGPVLESDTSTHLDVNESVSILKDFSD
jgi:hypothetical protein